MENQKINEEYKEESIFSITQRAIFYPFVFFINIIIFFIVSPLLLRNHGGGTDYRGIVGAMGLLAIQIILSIISIIFYETSSKKKNTENVPTDNK